MHANIVGYVGVFAYLYTAALIFRPSLPTLTKLGAKAYGWLAVALQSIYTGFVVFENQGFNFSFFSMSALVSMVVALMLLVAMFNKPVENLGIFLFPVAALMLALDLAFPERQRSLNAHSWQVNIHIVASIIAFSLLNIAALQAVLLAVQNQQLRSHPPRSYLKSMPSLQTMESLLFQMIGAGVALLTVSLGSGFLYVDNIFAQHQAHKTFFSILAWLIFTGLLAGRIRLGWRGQTAIKWTLLGFLFLLMAYFGSKLVKEIILNR